MNDDDQPITGKQLKHELDMLRSELKTERLERQCRNLWRIAFPVSWLVYIISLVMMFHAIMTRTR